MPGGGKGSWSAWKAGELSRRYEEAGGGYKNVPGSKNKPQKGQPEEKSKHQRDVEQVSGRTRSQGKSKD